MLDREQAATGGNGKAHANGAAPTASSLSESSSELGSINPDNLAFVEQLYESFVSDPASVDPVWRAYFATWEGQEMAPDSFQRSIFGGTVVAPPAAPSPAVAALVAAAAPLIRKTSSVTAERVQRLVEAYRETGHLAAELDPLGMVKRSNPDLELEHFQLTEADLDNVFSSENVAGPDRTTLRDLVAHLRDTYCRHIGVELAHLHEGALRSWLLERMETSRNRVEISHEERLHMLSKVVAAEVFEQFLHTKFPGKRRFSLEGGDSVIPLLERLTARAAAQGVTDIVIGMAHRGRLNVLVNILEKPAAQIFAEFMDKERTLEGPSGGDVKYHLGFSVDRTFVGDDGQENQVHLSLAFNPSHLEWVNTVVQGRVRAKQDRAGDAERWRTLPLLIHGDAAFAGQGIVAEAFNMSELAGYRVGGTIHVVINNQIGFTTEPKADYSTTYATDVARMLQIPIFHVNGEDPEAVAQVVDLAVDFRNRFHRDALIEVWCYRRWGHNEGDEPEFTQPLMYRAVKQKKPAHVAFLEHFKTQMPLVGPELTAADVERITGEVKAKLDAELEVATKLESPPKPSTFAGAWSRVRGGAENQVPQVPTNITVDTLRKLGDVLSHVPQDFTLHPKLKLPELRGAMARGERPADWGMGEALAFGSIVAQGIPVRLSGQDCRRGTFSHRHSTLVDYQNGREYVPLAHVGEAFGVNQGRFEVLDSPLSEAGVLGYEYGYSLDMPDGLTIWEAQFGDFVNGAQVIIDQFLVSSEAKWHRVSGLVMLLPHGMEGQGPEHSSGRLERFLTMGVNDNIYVCNLTTPAQFFHVLRRQVLRPYRKPLIIMTPKSLLRHPEATSTVADFTEGRFRTIIPDTAIEGPKARKVLLCTGKVYYDLLAHRKAKNIDDVAIIRIEQLYPMHKDTLLNTLSIYPAATPVVWVQEEPRNMGGWTYVNRELQGLLAGSFAWSCVSRPLSASPAAGSMARHELEQAKLIEDAFSKA
jgi:2-oxoglutarate dehydrogenase E1 component